MATNDMAALREALESVREWCINKLGNSSFQVTVEGLLCEVNAALSAPPRQCDIGTADAQSERFKHEMCDNLPSCKPWDECCLRCFAKWSQMPYAAERKGDGDGR